MISINTEMPGTPGWHHLKERQGTFTMKTLNHPEFTQ